MNFLNHHRHFKGFQKLTKSLHRCFCYYSYALNLQESIDAANDELNSCFGEQYTSRSTISQINFVEETQEKQIQYFEQQNPTNLFKHGQISKNQSIDSLNQIFKHSNEENLRRNIDDANEELNSFLGEKYITQKHNYKHNQSPVTNIINTQENKQQQLDQQQLQTQQLYYQKHHSCKNFTNQFQDSNSKPKMSHVNEQGQISMVDVSSKSETTRTAVASAVVILGKEAFEQVQQNLLKKGDVLSVAKIAGIMGAKQTSQLIPLCHNIPINKVNVETLLDGVEFSVGIECSVVSKGITGVEMEALTGASIAALTVYDMCKAVSKAIVIKNVQLEKKEGGKSGDYVREQ